MTNWVATGFGALDLREHELSTQGFEVIVTPSRPGEPRFLFGTGATLWRQLVAGPIEDSYLSTESIDTLHALAEMNIASHETGRASRVARLDAPWLASVIHEMVYALLANVAKSRGIDIVFIKGPTLYAQGLRVREHSGDVDCWVRPGDELRLAEAMSPWGWTPLFSAFEGTGVPHSLTLRQGAWGCAIDVHTRFPGMDIDPNAAFDIIKRNSESRSFAGVSVLTPSRPVHAVIAALHEVRPYLGQSLSRRQREAAQYAIRAAGADILPVVQQLRASAVLSSQLRTALPDCALPSHGAPPPDWAWRSMPVGARRYLVALRLVPASQRARVFWQLLWPSMDQLRVAYETPEASRWQLTKLRLSRVMRSAGGFFQRR